MDSAKEASDAIGDLSEGCKAKRLLHLVFGIFPIGQ